MLAPTFSCETNSYAGAVHESSGRYYNGAASGGSKPPPYRQTRTDSVVGAIIDRPQNGRSGIPRRGAPQNDKHGKYLSF